jgi:serine/threonine protein phosphatase PrpC
VGFLWGQAKENGISETDIAQRLITLARKGDSDDDCTVIVARLTFEQP